MPTALFALLALALTLYLLDQLGLYLERKGLFYYRKSNHTGHAGPALRNVEEFIRPEVRHVVEEKDRQQVIADDKTPSSR